MNRRQPARRGLGFERRILLLSLMAGAPGSAVAMALLWTGDFSPKLRWTATIFVALFWIGFALSVRTRVTFPLRTLSHLLGALREGDYSIRARGARRSDALGELMFEMNTLSEMLRDQRLDSMEATALLRQVMTEIDVAVFAFDAGGALRLTNRAAERLLARPAEWLIGRSLADLGLGDLLEGEPSRVVEHSFAGRSGRWEARRSTFRQGGLPLSLLVITDVSRALREEERQAWQRLIRVLGHEMNNSLAPIRSIAGSLETLLQRHPRPDDWEKDVRRGLEVIASRSESLIRFMDSYARLARLPRPEIEPIDLGDLVRRVAGLETRLKVEMEPGPNVTVRADPDQIEQLLINLLRNAVDAAMETGGAVRVTWRRNGHHVDLLVQDEGPGLPNTSNLFVPFYTTKPGGTGIGLVLSRQIAEAHGGSLTLENRASGKGCEARLSLPL